jgi:thiamine-monophosphate kinase
MPLSEFDIIARFFETQRVHRNDVALGVGDDCALLQVPDGMELAVTIDTMVEGRHFPVGTSPRAIGHKALAVSLSDLAAMGAEPAWATLSLSLPDPEPEWLEAFAHGLFELAERFGVQLVGGDTVRGPLVVTTQLHGFVPKGRALRRSGARPGDDVYVSGFPGDAGFGLALRQGAAEALGAQRDYLCARLDYPEPRVALGRALLGVASAAVDVSDGLAADLAHILERSGVGARLELEMLPTSDALRQAAGSERALELALSAGDDYELCFTAAPDRAEQVAALAFPVSRIGTIERKPGIRMFRDGNPYSLAGRGFDHFGEQR